MAEAFPPFVFPKGMSEADAAELLKEAYGDIDDGKLLRTVHKELRRNDIDPPTDVQYVAEPHVEERSGHVEVCLHPDIMVYDEFPEMDDCLDTFEDVLNEMLSKRLEKSVKKWLKARRP
ncbi:MAG TPA: hypothetical protein VGB18_01165 [Candidatus Thermoplasmatota archaeon]